jgi:predicted aminopeptidase
MQAINGQVGLLRQRVPIDEVIQDPAYDAATRERLELVGELRRFAVEELALPESKSYTTYVNLGRDYVVWNVVAAGEFSIEPETWCFPVAGCVSYRGYFDRAKALAFAEKLSGRGLDTFTGGSPAYSTLGHFKDPVLNTMLTGSEANIAATLFHELAHQRFYMKGDTELSESFATAVEQFAVRAWLEHRNQAADVESYSSRLSRQRDFAELVRRQRERLASIYASGTDAESMRGAKTAAFEQMRSEYESLNSAWGGSGDYDGWFRGELNNASLVAVTSYQRWVAGLRHRLDVLGPVRFFAELEALAEDDPADRSAILDSWNLASETASLADHR